MGSRKLVIPLVAFAASCGGVEVEPIQNVTVTDGGTGGGGEGGETGSPDPTSDPGSSAPMTFYIAETTEFSNFPNASGNCDNDNVNIVTQVLRERMEDEGWTGTQVYNGASTLYDFGDPAVLSGGRDFLAADSSRVTVYASHGNINLLQWGQPGPTPQGQNDDCHLTINQDMGLGENAGDQSGALILATSCTMSTKNDNLPNNIGGGAEIGQAFGWDNSPSISSHTLAFFFVDTGPTDFDPGDTVDAINTTNRESFLINGQERAGVLFEENSPVVFTPGRTGTEVINRHFGAQMALGTGLDEEILEPQDPNIYNYSWIDNGNAGGASCGA